jgi:hypothetical protein
MVEGYKVERRGKGRRGPPDAGRLLIVRADPRSLLVSPSSRSESPDRGTDSEFKFRTDTTVFMLLLVTPALRHNWMSTIALLF